MKIGLDLRHVASSDRGYRRMMNLVESLDRLGTDFEFELISEPCHEIERRTWSHRTRSVPPQHRFRALRRRFLGRARSLLFSQPDLMHFFTGDVWTVPSCPTLVTLHDLAPLQMPEIFFSGPEQEEAYRRHIETVFEVSERVVTVSDFSRDDLIRRFPSGASKLRVIHQGVDPVFLPEPWADGARERFAANLGAPRGYVFYCGGIDGRKNLDLLLDAYRRLIDKHQTRHRLIIAGPADRSVTGGRSLRDMVFDRRLGSDVILLGWVSDALLSRVYSGADLFLFPSRMEGFGYAPLEAMACGCPVICSNAAALPETVGEAARLLPPENPELWSHTIQELLEDRSEQASLRESGFIQVKRYDWDKSALEFLSLYREILRRPVHSGPPS